MDKTVIGEDREAGCSDKMAEMSLAKMVPSAPIKRIVKYH